MLAVLAALPAASADFSGTRALEFTRQAVSFGPRPPGSPALDKLRAHILEQLRALRCEVAVDAFTAQTPRGAVAMRNIIARFPGRSGRALVFSGHYDTKWFPRIRFVGANDGGASTGFLLEMAHALSGRPRKDDVWLVWFDGEEAFGEWSDTDGAYGSRHLAQRWAAERKLARIKALINVDMIGDRDLGILREAHSTPWLMQLIWDTAARLGLGRHFLPDGGPVEDDHVAFLRAGVSAANLIDFDDDYWHTEADTMDKLSAGSFQVVGAVLLEVTRKLEEMN
jgi:Zn-dependent M28 family amino/carboxypeptidase